VAHQIYAAKPTPLTANAPWNTAERPDTLLKHLIHKRGSKRGTALAQAHHSASASTQIRLLGPIEVVGPAGQARLSGTRQRALLGLLALHAPALIPRSRLIDALWGEDPPRTAIKTLHSHIARVRQALDECGLPDALLTREPGYLLAVDPAIVDAHRFEQDVRSAHSDLANGAIPRAVTTLRTGLALWQGDPFADAEPLGWAAAELARLHDVRLTALCELWDAELNLGRHASASAELERLLVTYPFQERLVRLAILALYRSGRHTDALEVYRRLRAHLADELGIDPGPELQQLHIQILRRDPSLDRYGPEPVVNALTDAVSDTLPMPKPAELPAPVGHFTGRVDESVDLDRLLDQGRHRVVVISGAAGMGKTALAVQWGHQVVERFPDGQIFFDLRGNDPTTAMTPDEALAHVLTSLGLAANRLPSQPSARAGLYRSLLRDRRVLIVADNVASAEQVLPLVPATPTALVVATARGRLAAMATYHAVGAISLDALRHDDALALLGSVLGEERVAREPTMAADLVELCDRMPLALQIAAAKLASRPLKRISDLTGELSGEQRLDELSVEGDSRSVRKVFATAYHVLAPPTARVFRILGLHPGVTFTAHLAAAAVQLPLASARRAIEELAAAYLVIEADNGRYRFHDLIRLYAHECAQLDEQPGERDEAVARMLDWYLAIADAGNRIIDRGRDKVTPSLRHPLTDVPFPPDHHSALAFLDGERANMLPVIRYAAENGHQATSWQMTYLVTGFFDSRGHWGERIEICRWAVFAARQTGDAAAEGLMRSGLGVAHLTMRRFDDALDELGQALALMRASGDRRGEAHAYNNIAVAYAGMRRFEEAVEAYQQALTLHTAQDSKLGVALSLNNLGDAYVRMGRHDLSLEPLTRALSVIRKIGNIRLEAATLSGIGQAYLQQGEHDGALAHFEQALELRQQTGDRRYEADTLNNLGLTQLGRSDVTAALSYFTQARNLSQEIVDQHQEALALANIGRAQLQRHDLHATRAYLGLALALRARIPDPYEAAGIHRDLGDLEEKCGNRSEAQALWTEAIDLYRKANAFAEAEALAQSRPV
jgi:DNA-binding SARP family transcriptional activator/Tfp pilus assembly protein PilF